MPAPYLPGDVATRMANIFTRMAARGMTEAVQVWAWVPTLVNGVAVGRTPQLQGTIQAYVDKGSGNTTYAVEGENSQEGHTLYYPFTDPTSGADNTTLLNDANYPDRYLVFATRSTREHRVTTCQVAATYMYALTQAGGTADVLPNR